MNLKIAMLRSAMEGSSRLLPEPYTLEERIKAYSDWKQADPQFASLRLRQFVPTVPTVLASDADETATAMTSTTADPSVQGQQEPVRAEFGRPVGTPTRVVNRQPIKPPIMVSRPAATPIVGVLEEPVMATVLLESEAPVVAYREPSSLQWRYQNLLASNAPASMEIDDTGLNGANYPPIPMQMPVPMAMAMPMQMPLPAPMPVMYALQAPMPPHIMYGNTVFPCFPVRY